MPRLRIRQKWTRLPGPPSYPIGNVWENPTGHRVHSGGFLYFPDRRKSIDLRTHPLHRLARIHQPGPRNIRTCLLTAELILTTPATP